MCYLEEQSGLKCLTDSQAFAPFYVMHSNDYWDICTSETEINSFKYEEYYI